MVGITLLPQSSFRSCRLATFADSPDFHGSTEFLLRSNYAADLNPLDCRLGKLASAIKGGQRTSNARTCPANTYKESIVFRVIKLAQRSGLPLPVSLAFFNTR